MNIKFWNSHTKKPQKTQLKSKKVFQENQDNNRNLYDKLKFGLAAIEVVALTILSIIGLNISSKISHLETSAHVWEMRPLMKVDELDSRLALRNYGEGVAVNVVCAARIIGYTHGPIMANHVYFNLINAQFRLNTKSQEAMDQIYNVDVGNPPDVFPKSDLNYAYYIETLYPVINDLKILITYQDIENRCYYSLWDGKTWLFGDNICRTFSAEASIENFGFLKDFYANYEHSLSSIKENSVSFIEFPNRIHGKWINDPDSLLINSVRELFKKNNITSSYYISEKYITEYLAGLNKWYLMEFEKGKFYNMKLEDARYYRVRIW